MKNKKFIWISLSITFLLIITLFLYLSSFVQPKIIFTAQIDKISNEDYKRIMNNAQVMSSDKGIEKFRHINMHIKIITPFAIINHAKIENDPLQQYFIQPYLKGNTKIQILSGGGFAQGNGMEYAENEEIYMKNISEDELKNILGDLKVKVLWQNIWNKKDNKIFYLKDYLK